MGLIAATVPLVGLATIFLGFLFLTGNWQDALFFTYLAGVLWFGALGALLVGPKRATLSDVLVDELERVEGSRAAKLARFGDRIGSTLSLMSLSLTWPDLLLASRRILRRLPQKTLVLFLMEMRRPEKWLSPLDSPFWTLAATGAVYVGSYWSPDGRGYAFAFLACLTAGAFLRHAAFAIKPGQLLTQVRIFSDRPGTFFVLIFLAELACLSLLLPVVLDGIAPASVGLSDILKAITDLYSVDGWVAFASGQDLSPQTLCRTLIALAFNLALAHSMLRGVLATKTDADSKLIAAARLERGEREEALATLASIRERDADVAAMESIAALQDDDVSKAKEAVRHGLNQFRFPPEDKDTPILTLTTIAAREQVSPYVWAQIMRHAIEDGVSDACLTLSILNALGAGVDFTVLLPPLELFAPGEIERYATEDYPVTIDLIAALLQRSDFDQGDPTATEETENQLETIGPLPWPTTKSHLVELARYAPAFRRSLRERAVLPQVGLGRLIFLALCEFLFPAETKTFDDLTAYVAEIGSIAANLRNPTEVGLALVCIGVLVAKSHGSSRAPMTPQLAAPYEILRKRSLTPVPAFDQIFPFAMEFAKRRASG